MLPGLPATKLVKAEIAFLGSFNQSLKPMDMNMEMGKGIGECQGILGLGHIRDAISVEFFKQNESKECREFS